MKNNFWEKKRSWFYSEDKRKCLTSVWWLREGGLGWERKIRIFLHSYSFFYIYIYCKGGYFTLVPPPKAIYVYYFFLILSNGRWKYSVTLSILCVCFLFVTARVDREWGGRDGAAHWLCAILFTCLQVLVLLVSLFFSLPSHPLP